MSAKGSPVFVFSLPGGGGSPPCHPVSYATVDSVFTPDVARFVQLSSSQAFLAHGSSF